MDTTLLLAHTISPDWSRDLVSELKTRLPEGLIENATTPAETTEKVVEADILVVGRLQNEWLAQAQELTLVQSLWAGVDMYPLDRIDEAGVAMANASGVHAKPIAEHVLGYMLQFERGLTQAVKNRRRGVWEHISGGELGTKTVGIIGVGEIGSRVSELATAFGMETVGTKRDTSSAPASIDTIFPASEYQTVLQQSDYLVLSCPLTETTEGLLGVDEFRMLNRDATVINVARGEIIDQTALVRALRSGMIQGAALDVFEQEPLPPESPLWDLSNVIVTPHMAWRSPQTTQRWADLLVENYRAVASKETDSIVNRVL
ncbi:D-2-hydroxyacid dehydrogenase [Halovenus rubra]|uniref:D-2-hydroxyacid dehydrogenase n=2 Tax=Halovenus rubra TaxID=869890 RepID=A0ACC7DYS1_9EURY|nr:D-2-hydroxyacid dehydrogenase [Halovenus rubra]